MSRAAQTKRRVDHNLNVGDIYCAVSVEIAPLGREAKSRVDFDLNVSDVHDSVPVEVARTDEFNRERASIAPQGNNATGRIGGA